MSNVGTIEADGMLNGSNRKVRMTSAMRIA